MKEVFEHSRCVCRVGNFLGHNSGSFTVAVFFINGQIFNEYGEKFLAAETRKVVQNYLYRDEEKTVFFSGGI